MSIAATPPRADVDLLEARVAAGLARVLSEGSHQLPADVGERLRFARERALARARDLRPATPVVAAPGGVAVLGRLDRWRAGLAGLVSALALALGLVMLDHWQQRERSQAAAEVDALLLADQVPPAAYTDPGFVAFLKLSQP